VTPSTGEDDDRGPLAVRFRNVSVATSAHERTRVQLCGQMSVEIEGVELAQGLRGRQVRLLLAYLLLNRTRPLGREELIGALWPSQAPVSQDAALRTLLSRLRSALGPSALRGREELSLSFPEPVWVDFEAAGAELGRAQTALEEDDARTAWGLAQIPLNIASRGLLPGAQADWLEPARRDLEDIRLQALEVVGGAGLRLGGAQLGSVERAARALIEAEPYRESGYTLLMQSQAIRGNVAEGIRVFDRLRTLLREELGTVPSAEAIASHDRLIHRESTALGERRSPTPGQVELPAELKARAQATLIGRDAEVGELTKQWSLARAGPPPGGPTAGARAARVVVLSGDAGIGKTSLAAELARRAHEDGAVVLAGRAPEEGLAPYQPFLEALSHYFATADLDEIRGALREHGPELSRLVPELRHRAPDLPAPPAEPDGERYRLFESVVGLLSSIAQHAPILLVLDDLQWADRPTLLLLRHLARSPRPQRLLVLLAFRTEAATDALHDFLSEMSRDGLSTQLDIRGLGERDTAVLVRARAGERPSSAFGRRIHRETEGNPFFIEEIVRNLVAAGVHVGTATASALQRFELPEGVKRMVARRLDRLDPKTIEWLRVASVAGRDFDAELLEQLLDLDEEEFLTALEEALAAGVLLESTAVSGRYSFSHALIREALYESMSAPRRARLHRRVGEALEAAGQQPLSTLALHFTRAAGSKDAEKAISYAVQAAQEATGLLAHEEALEHYGRALEVLTRYHAADSERRLELLLDLGDACVRSGDRPRARSVFLEAAALAEVLDDTAGLVRAAVGASRRYVQQPGVVDEELIGVLDRATEKTAGEMTVDRVRLLARMCGTLYYTEQRDRTAILSEEATEIALRLRDPEPIALSCAARRQALWNPSHLTDRLAISTEMLAAAQEAGQLELQLQAHAWLVTDLLESGNLTAVDAQIAAFGIGAEQLRQPLFRWQAMVWRAMRALLDGRLEAAEEAAAEALVTGGPGETVTAPQYFAVQLMNIRREQDRAAEVEEMIRRTAEANPARLGWRVGLGLVLVDTGRIAEAQAEVASMAVDGLRDLSHDGDWLPNMAMLGQLVSRIEDTERAAILYELLGPYGSANIVRGLGAVCLGPVARVLGRLASLLGRDEEARQHFQTALRIATSLRAPALLAHAQLDYAEALGRGAEAVRLCRAAAVTGQDLGLPAVARRAERLRLH
jgi:DNA-binding SARP family transcriptional activator/tetratricopeptide (TPR) repeat protein